MSCKHEQETAGCVACEFEPFVKNNYFTGKMMGAAEFISETHFHQEKLRLHQVRLHGWGVVCGLNVRQHPNMDCQKRYVRIEPGSALDCCGHDILVPEEEMLDLLSYQAVADLAKENPARLHALGICVRFLECATENVPVLYDDCGCDDDGCAPNRILESYAFEVQLDPPLTFLPRLRAADLAAGIFVRSADPVLAANTPRFGIAPLVGATLYTLDAAHPTRLLAFDLSTRHATSVDSGAKAFAIAGRGNFLFAATTPTTGTADLLQVYKPDTAAPLAKLEVTGTTVANTLALATSSDANRAAIVYVKETGALFAFAEDATTGLQGAATTLGSVAAKLTAFIAKPDGSTAYAIDEAAATVKTIALAAASTATDLGPLPASAKPSSLAYMEFAGKTWLVVASRADKALYVFDLAAATSLATIPLDHPPEYIAVGAQGVVYAVEEEGSADFLQAVDLAPLASAQPAIVFAARLIESAGLNVIALEQDASAGIVATSRQLEIACDEIIWHQDCTACSTANCVTLATIERYQTGATLLDADPLATLADDLTHKRARIDNRAGRKVLASTQTLQAWLECLQLKGGLQGKDGKPGADGQNGKDAVGLYPNLPKILDIGWRFEETRNVTQFVTQYLGLYTVTAAANAEQRIITAVQQGEPPPLTLYFNQKMKGITRRTLSVRIEAPMPAVNRQQQFESAGVYLPIELRMYGDLIEIPGPVPTPHTGENAAYAVSFLPRPQFFTTVDANGQPQMAWPALLVYYLAYINRLAQLDEPQVSIDLKGDFVFAPDGAGNYTELGVLDGDNIGGRVGAPPPAARLPPLIGGKNPSGNLTQGGLFQSWFFLSFGDAHIAPMEEAIAATPTFSSFGASALGLRDAPHTANFSSADAIRETTGVSAALARRIVEERTNKPFTGVTDFRTRLGLSERDWTRLKTKLVIV